MDILPGLIVSMASVLFYFLSAIIGSKRKYKNQNPIALTNLFLGWSEISWIICLIRAASSHVEEKQEVVAGLHGQ